MSKFYLLLLICVFNAKALANEEIKWSSNEYQQVAGDFDGDGVLDFFVVSRSSELPSLFIPSSSQDDFNPEVNIHFDSDSQLLLSGDFNGNGKDEILVLSKDMVGYHWFVNKELKVKRSAKDIKIKRYDDDSQIDISRIFAGDFNGDGLTDVMAWQDQTHEFVVFRNKTNENRKLKFVFRDAFSFDSGESLTPYIHDFNSDNHDDIILLPTIENGNIWVAFADKKGRFKRAEFEDITASFGGQSWNANEHVIKHWVNPQTGDSELLRLANATGGYSADGEWIRNESEIPVFEDDTDTSIPPLPDPHEDDDNDEIEGLDYDSSVKDFLANPRQSLLSKSNAETGVRQISATAIGIKNNEPNCNDQSYSFSLQTITTVCADGSNNAEQGTVSSSNLRLVSSYNEAQRPSTPTQAPTVVGGFYQPANGKATITFPAIEGADYYRLLRKPGGGSYQFIHVGSARVYEDSLPSQAGDYFYKYSGCNYQVGCSANGPLQHVKIYDKPSQVPYFRANRSTATSNKTVTVYWNSTAGLIPNGYFQITEKPQGGSTRSIGGSISSTKRSFAISASGKSGTYTYTIKACNPKVGCGSASSISVYMAGDPLPAPTSAPIISGGKYHAINSSVTITMPQINRANLYRGIRKPGSGSYTQRYLGNSRVFTDRAPSQPGDYFYKYKSCINDVWNCSTNGPLAHMVVYGNPGTVKNLSASTASLKYGQSTTLTWSNGSGTIPIAYYKISETAPSGGKQTFTSNQPSFTVFPDSGVGSYRYDVTTCNSNSHCGNSVSTSVTLLNSLPLAQDDVGTVDEGATVTVNVLDNDSDLDGDPLSISNVGSAVNGTATCDLISCSFKASNNLTANVTGEFTYTISDGKGGVASAKVSISIRNTVDAKVDSPTISPNGGTFSGSQRVTISTTTPGAYIYYTTDGSTPTTSSKRYTGEITISQDTTIKVTASKPEHSNSDVVSASFTKSASQRKVVFVHTDILGSPVAETEEDGN